jgi:hypothetical protein
MERAATTETAIATAVRQPNSLFLSARAATDGLPLGRPPASVGEPEEDRPGDNAGEQHSVYGGSAPVANPGEHAEDEEHN